MQIIDRQIIEQIGREAEKSPRLRMNKNFHDLEDPVQRFVNVVLPESYTRPHCHEKTGKIETLILLSGKGKALLFEPDGALAQVIELGYDRGVFGVHLTPLEYHSILAETEPLALFEIAQGPYSAVREKTFPAWAPEDSKEGLAWLKEKLKTYEISL